MRSFKHPIRAIREPFGTAGLIVAMIALIAAVGGVAVAAKGGLTAQQKKEVKKIAKSVVPTGPAGAAGPAGPAGGPGTAGAPGAPGAVGATGPSGKNGTNGTNGVTGPTGPLSPVLLSGMSETGFWTDASHHATNFAEAMVPISYPIRLAKRSEKVVILDLAKTETSFATPIEGCKYEFGSVEAVPIAPPGTLCIFTTEETEGKALFTLLPGTGAEEGDTPAGTLLWTATSANDSQAALAGVWAVTAK